eukprot:13491394-Alexandrium_andersonii.AAC.1
MARFSEERHVGLVNGPPFDRPPSPERHREGRPVPSASASVTGQRGQPGTPNSGTMPTGSQAGAHAQPRQAVRWA